MFIADFYCHKAKLVTEIDGSIHEIEDLRLRDIGREHEFEKFGLTTIRFKNEDVIDDINMVINKIASACRLKCPYLKDLPLPASPNGEVRKESFFKVPHWWDLRGKKGGRNEK